MQPRASSAPPVAERTSHPYLTYDMIQGIPASAAETLRVQADAAAAGSKTLAQASALCFTGCGTASYSALLAQRVVSAASGARDRSEARPALELSGYGGSIGSGAGVVGISHSGITKATVDALRQAKGRGAATVGVTHFRDRPIQGVADTTLIVGDGPDRSRCHTKCYVSGALGAATVGLEWIVAKGLAPRGPVDGMLSQARGLPDLQGRVLRAVDSVSAELAETHLHRRATFIVGTGGNEATALEAALKLKETSFIPAEGMETEQFLHGSWQALDSESLVFVVASHGPGHARSIDLIRAATTIGAHVVAIAAEGDREVEQVSPTTIALQGTDEWMSPFLNILPLYLYAYYASVQRGNNPDMLRYLEPPYWAAREIVFPPGTH